MDPTELSIPSQGVEPSEPAQGKVHVGAMDHAGFPTNPTAVESTIQDPVADPLRPSSPPLTQASSSPFDDPDAVDDCDPVDCDPAVPAQDMAELLLSRTPCHTPVPPTNPPVQAAPDTAPTLLADPKPEPLSADELASIPLPPGTPPPESSGAAAPSHDNVCGSTAPKSNNKGFSKFSYASVVARQKAAEDAEAASAKPSAPLPAPPVERPNRKRPANRLTVTTHHKLPERTPEGYTHRLLGRHPWAKFVVLHEDQPPSDPSVLTSVMPLDLYSHVPPAGYLSARYVRRLFPHRFRERPCPRRRLSIIELMRLDHAISFRESSQTVVDTLLRGDYVITENTRPITPEGSMPSTRTHMLTATIPDLAAFPLRLNFTIADMSSECGWVNQRPVYLWVVGARSLIRATIQHSEHSYEDRSMSIRLCVPIWAHKFALQTVKQFATTRDDITYVPICVKLGPPPAGADPLYQLIAQRQLFGQFSEDSRASAVLDAVYGTSHPPIGPVGPQQEPIVASVG
ncbi:hypothetical protein OSTOST_15569, partial [Ostertagia ostertagi]